MTADMTILQAARPAATGAHQSTGRTAAAGLIGNVLEWFDFAVYGYFATVIGQQFFPQSSPGAQQLLSFAVFALGFGARPIGSLVLGRVGDRIGRRPLLVLSIAMMGVSTLLIGLLPTYDSIGVAAPLLLMLLRLIQGFSVGGEFTGSMVYTTESSAAATRGFDRSSESSTWWRSASSVTAERGLGWSRSSAIPPRTAWPPSSPRRSRSASGGPAPPISPRTACCARGPS